MGRFLQIARCRPILDFSLPPLPSAKPFAEFVPLPPADDPFDPPAADVLHILVQADQPVSHTNLVSALIARGHEKTAARQAIARCQKRRWIEHDLETGYVLT